MTARIQAFALRRHARTGLFTRLAQALAVHRQRRQLARLEDHLLRDIGLTRAAALAEAERPLWDAPAHWRQ